MTVSAALLAAVTAPAACAKPVRKPARTPAPSPAIPVVVGGKGTVRLSAASVRQLHPKRAKNGLVCVEFPPPPQAKAPPHKPGEKEHESGQVLPVRVWLPTSRDGSLEVRRLRLTAGAGSIPGAPGTRYVARGTQGRIVFSKPAR